MARNSEDVATAISAVNEIVAAQTTALASVKTALASKTADISLGLTGAAVGDIIKVKAVDADGKPTEWVAAEMPKMRLIKSIVLEEDVTSIASFNTDDDGQPFNLSAIRVIVTNAFITVSDYAIRIFISHNDTAVSSDRSYFYYTGSPIIGINPDSSKGCASCTIDLRRKAVENINTSSADTGLTTGISVQPANTQNELTIKSIVMGMNNSNNSIPAGAKIEVWGVDA